MFKTIGFLSREVGFLAKKWVLLMKKTNPYGKSIGKSPKTAKIGRKIAKSGWISTIFVENLTKHQARAYSGREALNRAHREAFRGKSQVGGNPENPGFYPALGPTSPPHAKKHIYEGDKAHVSVIALCLYVCGH
jgi:hypothetical protein